MTAVGQARPEPNADTATRPFEAPRHLCIVVLMDRWAYPSAAAMGAALVGERRGTLGEEDLLQRFRQKATSLPRKRAHEGETPPVGHMLGQR